MLILIWLWVVGTGAQQQSTLTQPPFIETDLIVLKQNNSTHPLFTFTFTTSFIQTYVQDPAVYLSLVRLDTLVSLSISTFVQQLYSLYTTKFVIQATLGMSAAGTTLRMAEITVMYLAYDFPTYPFIELNVFSVEPTPNQPHQILPISYPIGETLDPSREYMLNAFISGYENLLLTGTPWLYMDALMDNDTQYLLDLQLDNLSVGKLYILRMLIDKTDMNSRVTGPSDLICSTGTIEHFSDPNVLENNPEPSYLPFSMMYGIKGWQGLKFDLPSLTYIFRNSDPRIQANIGYLLLLTKTCPSNQGYVIAEDLCYAWSAAFYYQLTPETMAPCPYTCYQCVGPLSANCQSCVQGWNRYLSLGSCLCLPGFYDPGGPICQNCTEAISGCYTCSSSTNCLTCLPGCTPIGFSPIYCDCPSHVQTNFSFNCPQHFYYEHDQDKCMCYPQTYLNSDGVCYPCPKGCYLCVGQTNCLLCLDSYILVGTSCLFYYNSYVLLGQTSSLDSPEARCLRWDSDNLQCLQQCTRYYYQFNCYGECPVGTFSVTSPWLTCQPCKITCEYCYNFTVCFQCHSNYFYFNSTTFACERCSANCLTCKNDSYCTSCQEHYYLTNYSCHPTIIPQGTCLNCIYCLDSQCLICQDSFYLNYSSYTCFPCDHPGFALLSGSCLEICGDGILVYAACDDGNLINGDGCSSSCQVQISFSCRLLEGRSRCWKPDIALSWQIYNIFGANQLILEVMSPANLSNNLMNLTCSFEWILIKKESGEHLQLFVVEYREPTVLPMDLDNPFTFNHITSINASNRCYLKINQLFSYTIVVNTVPESLLIDYQGTQATADSSQVRTAVIAMGLSSVALLCLGLGPVNAYATVRVSLLLLVGYLDYYQIPINSFGAFQGLQGLIFKQPCTNTKDLSVFERDEYIGLFWKAVVLCVGTIIFQEIVLKLLLNLIKTTNWEFLEKLLKHIHDHRRGVYWFLSSAYQVVWWVWIFRIFQHSSEAGVGLLLLTALLLLIIIASKVHLFLTIPQLTNQSPYVCHSLLTDQFQNIAVAMLIIFCSAQVSYTAPILFLFSVYSISSLLFSDKVPIKGPFYISQNVALYHYVVSLSLFCLIQVLKCVNMWRPVGDNYESLSVQLGLWISLLSSGTVGLSWGLTMVGASIRVCQVRLEGQKQDVLSATVENMSVDHSQASH